MRCMTDVTNILNAIQRGDHSASDRLLPLIYEELKGVARFRLRNEKPGQTLHATALVHEAYIRLIGNENEQKWDSRGHFFAAAAEAMRRILIDAARRKSAEKHGGNVERVDLTDFAVFSKIDPSELLVLNETLELFAGQNPEAASIVKLHIFAEFSIEQAGELLGMSRATAYRHWTYARAWLKNELFEEDLNCDQKKR